MRISIAVALTIVAVPPARAQRVDTTRIVSPASGIMRDSLAPPISPRRAFVYSLLAPGYAQSVLRRNKAATGFLLFEAIAISMIRESAADVHEARRTLNDTLVLSWIDANGHLLTSPDTTPIRFGDKELRARKAHVEDWIAVLVANHLFAGADAYVAANLWDVPARVGLRLTPQRATVTASFKW
jgi:hypothetical protein